MLDTPRPVAARTSTDVDVELGDIVRYAAPGSGDGGRDAVRPWLVVEVSRHCGREFLSLAPAVKKRPRGRSRGDVVVDSEVGIARAGLTGRTRFAQEATSIVSPSTQPERVGRLTGASLDRLQAARARAQALRDLTADRRRERARGTKRSGRAARTREALRARGGRA